MLEKIASEMRAAYGAHSGDSIVSWSNATPEKREAWMVCARAAIEAMREPTPEMVTAAYDRTSAGGDPIEQGDERNGEGWVPAFWRAMIDAAKGGKP